MPLSSYDQYEFRCCPKCGIEYAAPKTFMEECRKDPTIYFHCPNGHGRHFSESEADKLRKERDRLAQRIAEKDDQIRHQRELTEAADRRAAAARGQVTKIKNRVGHGVCPCCNRTFENLHRHMATQHPTFTAEAAE
jgi:uncharacterized protein with NRDE domain